MNTSKKVQKVIATWCFLMLISSVANAGRAGAGAGQYQTKGEEFVEIIKDKVQIKSISSLLKTTHKGVIANAERHKGSRGLNANNRYLVECYETGKAFSEEVAQKGLGNWLAKYGVVCQISSVAYVPPKENLKEDGVKDLRAVRIGYFEKQNYGYIEKGGANYKSYTVKGFNAKILMHVHLRHVGAVKSKEIDDAENKKTASIVISSVGVGIQELVPRAE